MADRRFLRLPVVNKKGKLVGIVSRALANGADAFLLKDGAADTLVAAILAQVPVLSVCRE